MLILLLVMTTHALQYISCISVSIAFSSDPFGFMQTQLHWDRNCFALRGVLLLPVPPFIPTCEDGTSERWRQVNSVDWTLQNQSSDLFSLVGFHVKAMYCTSVFFNLQRGFNTGRSRVWTAVVRVDCFPGFRWSTFTVSSSHIIDNTDKVGSDLLVLQHHSFMCWLHISAYILPCLQIYAAYMLTHGHDGISANTKLTTVTAPKSSPLIPHHQLDAKLQQPVMGGEAPKKFEAFLQPSPRRPFLFKLRCNLHSYNWTYDWRQWKEIIVLIHHCKHFLAVFGWK